MKHGREKGKYLVSISIWKIGALGRNHEEQAHPHTGRPPKAFPAYTSSVNQEKPTDGLRVPRWALSPEG